MPRPVALICGKDPIREGGVGHTVYVRVHARAALRAGYEPHIFSVSPTSGTIATDFGYLHRVRSPWPYAAGRGIGYRQWLFWLHAPLLARAITTFGRGLPGPLIVHGFGPYGGVATASAGRIGQQAVPLVSAYTTFAHERAAKTRCLTRDHGLGVRALLRVEGMVTRCASERWERNGILGARLILVNYDSVRRLVTARYRRSDGFRVIPYTTDAAFTDPEAMPVREAHDGPTRILCVARHDPRKALHVLLEALALLSRHGVNYQARLVGGGQLINTHRRLRERLGLAGRVKIVGFVPDVTAELRAADLFVLPTLEEGSGSIALLEAFQNGLPAVATAVDGITEDMSDGVEGLLVPPGNAEALATALESLVADPTRRREMGVRARATFEARFEAAVFVRALGESYAEVCP